MCRQLQRLSRRGFLEMSSSTLAAGPLLFPGIALAAAGSQAAAGSNAPRRDYRKCFRRLVLDMHVPDWGPHLLAKFDPAATAETIRRAGIEYVMAYAQSHQGLCYWPTKIGTPHAGMKGRDFFGEFSHELRERDIPVCAYYCVVFNSGAIRDHHDWRMVGRPGFSFEEDYSGNRYGLACPNKVGYHRQTLAEVEELLRGYVFDVMFFDMAFWRTPCHCDACKQRYLKETGEPVPERIDWTDPRWCRFQAARLRWTGQFMQELTSLAKRIRPGLPVYHNMGNVLHNWWMGLSSEHGEHSDFLGSDFYGDSVQQLMGIKLYTNLSRGRPIEYMTSRAFPDVKEHVNNKSLESLDMTALAAVSQHAAFTLIDSINPDGTLDPGVYQQIKQVNRRIAEYEPELGGEPVEDIGVYFSSDSNVKFEHNGQPLLGVNRDKPFPHLQAVRGVCRALQESHRPFGVITRKQLGSLGKYKLIVLPDVLRMDRTEAKALADYAHTGGRIYASRWTSLTETSGRRLDDFLLADVFGCHFQSDDTGQVNFLKPSTTPIRKALLGQAYLSHNNSADQGTGTLYLSEELEGKMLGTLTKAYFQVPGNVVDNKFESLHTTPPARDTTQPMLVQHEFGEGQSVYCAANLESGESPAHRSLFLALIDQLGGGQWSFDVDTHPTVWASVFDQRQRGRLVLSLLNYQVQLPPVPIRRVPFVLQPPTGMRFTRLMRLPRPEDIAFELDEDGAIRAEVRELDNLVMVAAEYEPVAKDA